MQLPNFNADATPADNLRTSIIKRAALVAESIVHLPEWIITHQAIIGADAAALLALVKELQELEAAAIPQASPPTAAK
jgi:hypothetical protein